MSTKLCIMAIMTGVFAAGTAGTSRADERAGHPHLKSALREMMYALVEVKGSRDDWPPTHRDRAIQALEDAIDCVKTILAVRNIDDYRGPERKPEHYRRFKDSPKLRAALASVRDARDELRAAKAEYRGLKERAYDDLDLAAADILILIRNKKPRP